MVGVIRVLCLEFCSLKMIPEEENSGREALHKGILLDFDLRSQNRDFFFQPENYCNPYKFQRMGGIYIIFPKDYFLRNECLEILNGIIGKKGLKFALLPKWGKI